MLLCSPRADILKKYDITWCIHGDDLVTTGDGEDTYGKVKAAGLFKYAVRPVYRHIRCARAHATMQYTWVAMAWIGLATS